VKLAFVALLLAGLALGHGESARTAPTPTVGPQVFPTGGPTSSPRDSRGGSRTTTLPEKGSAHLWTIWWAYNRDYILARRIRGVPISGTSRIPLNDRLTRKELREKKLFDLMASALTDKSHYVRSSAAVALGKFGDERANRYLNRHDSHPPEGWFDVREAAIYGMGILGLTDNRTTMKVIAGDKERSVKERGLSLVSLAMDRSEDSLAILEFHLDYHRSSLRLQSWQLPTLPEEEKRRVAAHLMGFLRDEGLSKKLFKVANGSRRWGPGVQGLAVTALGRRRARDYIPALFKMMARRETDDAVKQSIPIALGMMLGPKDEREIRRLARFIRDHRNRKVVQHFSIMALARIGGPLVEEILTELLRDNVFNNNNDRAFLYLGMGLLGRKGSSELLMGEYEKARTWEKRSSLALALGIARFGPAVKRTIAYLEKAHVGSGASSRPTGGPRGPRAGPPRAEPGFLEWGTLALGLHGDRSALPMVQRVLKKYRVAGIREKAATALALLKRQEAVRELVELLKETGNIYTKAAVVSALGMLPEPTWEAVDALIYAYRQDSFPDSVRAMAIIALGALGDPRAIPLSATLVSNYNYFIRSFALDEIASFL
jgi:HEAT repeat protein